MRAACDRHGTLLVFDEIPTGLGRTGAMFACQHDGVAPDILVLGKALGGGILPIAAVLARPELDVGADWAFGHYTHEKNPVTARAALTTIEIIESEGLVENAARVGALALERLSELKARNPSVGDVRGRGLLIGLEIVKDRESRQADRALAHKLQRLCLEMGLVVHAVRADSQSSIRLAPPLTVSKEELDKGIGIMDKAFRRALDS